MEDDGNLLVPQPPHRAAPRAPFLGDHSAFLLDLLRIEADVVRPILEHLQGVLHHVRLVHRHLQSIGRLVERGVGVQVRPELHARAFEEIHDLHLLEVLRAVEGHVLDEMRQPQGLLGFEDGARIHDEMELGAVLRLLVGANVVGQTVGKFLDRHGRVDGQRVRRGGGREQGTQQEHPEQAKAAEHCRHIMDSTDRARR
jgi:hypothetical protein